MEKKAAKRSQGQPGVKVTGLSRAQCCAQKLSGFPSTDIDGPVQPLLFAAQVTQSKALPEQVGCTMCPHCLLTVDQWKSMHSVCLA